MAIKATLMLGRDGMGPESTEDDFDSWVSFVSDRIDDACGFEVEVDVRGSRDVQEDVIVDYGNDDVRVTVREAKARLWDEWCAEGR